MTRALVGARGDVSTIGRNSFAASNRATTTRPSPLVTAPSSGLTYQWLGLPGSLVSSFSQTELLITVPETDCPTDVDAPAKSRPMANRESVCLQKRTRSACFAISVLLGCQSTPCRTDALHENHALQLSFVTFERIPQTPNRHSSPSLSARILSRFFADIKEPGLNHWGKRIRARSVPNRS